MQVNNKMTFRRVGNARDRIAWPEINMRRKKLCRNESIKKKEIIKINMPGCIIRKAMRAGL